MEDGSPWIAILITIILIIVNGLLASAEIAMMGLNEAKLKQSAQSGDKKAVLLLNMKQNPSNFLSTIQVGITLASLLSGAFAAESLAAPLVAMIVAMGVTGTALSVLRTLATLLVTLLMTYFMLVFGELVPKRIAMARPEKSARSAISIINGLAKVSSPLVKLLSVSTNTVLRLAGIDPSEENAAVTEEDILLMMREGHQRGEIEAQEVQILSNLFEFTDLHAEDIMTHRTEIEFVRAGAGIPDIVALISKTGYSKFPVYEKSVDDVVGVIYTNDILKHYSEREKLLGMTARSIMREPYFVYEQKPIDAVFTEMKHKGIELAVVVDEYGGTSGLITMLDIIQEIVGEIEDSEEMQLQEDGSYLVDGKMDFEDLEALLDLPEGGELDDEEKETLSGFIIQRLGYVPAADARPEISYKGYVFKVQAVKGALISSVSVNKLES